MKSPTQPGPWSPTSLPPRVPGEALAAVNDPDSECAQACRDRDAAEGAAMYWEGRAHEREQETDRMAAERDAAIVERDDLSTRTLPYLDTADWPQTDQPVGAVIAEQMDAEQAAPGFTGWS